jgi:hypothetical protein
LRRAVGVLRRMLGGAAGRSLAEILELGR